MKSLTESKLSFASKSKDEVKSYKKQATSLEAPTYVKILGYGNTGAGKTLAIGHLAASGFRVAGISTDFGGNGLNSVRNYLLDSGRSDALKNILNVDLDTFDEIEDFLIDPITFFPDLYSFDPDFLFWDGFSGYQQGPLADHIADKMKESKSEDGLKFSQQEWGMIRNGTVRPLNRFLNLHNELTGRKWHKYVTCLKSKPTDDKLTNETLRGPLVQGQAFSLMQPMFDLIIEMRINSKGDQREYSYVCVGDDKLMAKARGFRLNPVEKGDMGALWTKISNQMALEKLS